MSDEDYISRVLEGHEETTGRWMNARSSQRRSSHHRNEQGRRRPAIQDQWGRTRRRGSNRNRGAPPRGGRTRRGVLAVDEREQNDSDVDFWCRQCGQWLPRRDQQVHARLHFQAMLQGRSLGVFFIVCNAQFRFYVHILTLLYVFTSNSNESFKNQTSQVRIY